MQDHEAIARRWDTGALVFIYSRGSNEAFVRPAAFVYPGEGALSWVEPAYADPFGSSGNALHTREGELISAPGGGIKVVQDSGEHIVVRPYEDDASLVGDALDWFARYLRSSGKTFEEEREAVRAMITEG